MAGRVPVAYPQSVGSPRTWYNRQCVGGRDAPGHDDIGWPGVSWLPTPSQWGRHGRGTTAGAWVAGTRPAITILGGRACPGCLPPVSGVATDVVQLPVRGWPGRARPSRYWVAGRVPVAYPQSVGSPRTWYNCRCVGGRDAPGHDDMEQSYLPRLLILTHMGLVPFRCDYGPLRSRSFARHRRWYRSPGQARP